ncbi:LysM peptidoglycan-binding domain-containing protein, partial [Thermodesulfobacteriota bacterium]
SAIAYLKELHQIFGDWATVLAAYNCGEGKVLRVIRSQNVNYLDNFWDLYMKLPRETARYVPRFLATIHIINNLKKYGLDTVTLDPPLQHETVTVEKRVRLKDIANKIGATKKLLTELNPELRHNLLPPEKYELRVPPGKSEVLLANLDKIPESSSPQRAYVYHRVRPGETLSTIAARYGTSVRSIALANNIYHRNYIVAGKKLKIPQKGTKIYPLERKGQKTYKQTTTHVVKSGDNLWILAKRYGTTTKEIQKLNNIKTTNLYINQRLKIPSRNSKDLSKGTLKTYIVKSGDSPYEIARRHNISLKRFLEINHLTSRSTIYPGQTLHVQ